MLALAVVPLVLGAVAYTVVGGFVSMAAQTDTIGIGMPFSGKWGYDASTHPSQHHISFGGNWSTDVYAPSGTKVHAHFLNPSGVLKLSVESVGNTCAAPNVAGKTVKVRVRIDGVNVGFVSYSHLETSISLGEITNGAPLGKTKLWGYSSCYQVTGDAGTHVHLEAANNSATELSCYRNLTIGTSYAAETWLGNLGKPGVSKIQTACPAGTIPGDPNVIRQDRRTIGTAAGDWYLRNSNSAGFHDKQLRYGTLGDIVVAGDWDGNGTKTPGVFREGAWHLTNSPDGGASQITLYFGQPGDWPLVGDWNGDGLDSIGVFRGYPDKPGEWHLRNSLNTGPAQIIFNFGRGLDKPVVGDWNGDRIDTPGVFRAGTVGEWYLRNSNTTGSTNYAFQYGASTDEPVAGDWDGNGTDTPGVFRRSTVGQWYLRNSNP